MTKLWTVPRPLASTVSHASELQDGHIGRGGCRNAPQSVHRWIRSRCSFSPSQKNCVSGDIEGASRMLILGALGGRGGVAGGRGARRHACRHRVLVDIVDAHVEPAGEDPVGHGAAHPTDPDHRHPASGGHDESPECAAMAASETRKRSLQLGYPT